MTRPPPGYRWASRALAPAMAVHTLVRARRDGGWRYQRERHGYLAPMVERPIWLHCASVGEVATAAPLVNALVDAQMGPIAVSTNTPTGRERAREVLSPEVTLVYLAIDRPRPVARFLARLRPRAALILETELWPHLIAALHRRSVPIALVNARLSRRSLDAPRWWRRAAAWCLGRITAIWARSAADRAALLRLGAPPERVETVGSLKLATPTGPPPAAIPLTRAFVLAASTHADEEERLALAWRDRAGNGLMLAIAPRHPDRGPAIARRLRGHGLVVAQRSRGEAPPADGVYVADTLGELRGLMAGARLVIMGGSFIAHGGQNVVEAARAGRAIVTGPSMDNFAEETAGLEAAGALVRTDGVDAAVATADRLLAQADHLAAMERASSAWVGHQTQTLVHYHERVARLLVAPETTPAVRG